MLSRNEILKVIASGQSVTVKGQVYSARNVSELPSQADLVAGDPAAEEKVAASIDKQIAQLQADKAKLAASKPKAEETKAVEAPKVAEAAPEAPKAEVKQEAKAKSDAKSDKK